MSLCMALAAAASPVRPLGGRGIFSETEASMLNRRLLRAVLRNTGLARAT